MRREERHPVRHCATLRRLHKLPIRQSSRSEQLHERIPKDELKSTGLASERPCSKQCIRLAALLRFSQEMKRPVLLHLSLAEAEALTLFLAKNKPLWRALA